MIKNLFLSIFLFSGLFTSILPTFAEEQIQIFVREDCAHCADEKAFLNEEGVQARLVDIRASEENKQLFDTFTNTFELQKGTPVTLAGDKVFAGFHKAETTGKSILEAYSTANTKFSFEEAIEQKDQIQISGRAETCDEDGTECVIAEDSFLANIYIPFFGEQDLRESSRLTISFVLGFLDGFNPCAMWVLVIFLITLVQIGDRVKMAFVAGTFLIAEMVMYGLILVLWWTFFDFVGFEEIVKPIVGIVAIGGGIFFLYEGFYTDGTCNVTNMEQRKKISDKISEIAHNPLSIATFFAILALAFSVNIIEVACSAGYPQLFTNILNSASVDIMEKVTMLAIYLGAYMVDDLIVFGIALISIEKLGITHKYAKYSNILGGVLMLLLGALMIFAPQYLMM
jgi:cytochrome c biogenesis protein CcdA/glutaredoxin